MNFSNFFTANNCRQRVNAIIHDNNLVEYGENIYEHISIQVENNDQEIYLWLNRDKTDVFEKMDNEHQSKVKELFNDWLKDNYNYTPGE